MEVDESGSSSVIVVESGSAAAGWENSLGRENVLRLLDTLDTSVENLRKDALKLHESRDQLLIRIEMLKTTNFLAQLKDSDKEDALLAIDRINKRLQTVDITVKTVRDDDQISSLLEINFMIDEIIRLPDPIQKRQKFLAFYASCSSEYHHSDVPLFDDKFDRQFEKVLLGCTLDDQKKIKSRVKNLLNFYRQEMCEKEPL